MRGEREQMMPCHLRSRISSNVFLHVPWSAETSEAATQSRLAAGVGPGGAETRTVDGDGRQGTDGSEDDARSRVSDKILIKGTSGSQSAESKAKAKVKLKLVFFITGNPGCVGYYHPFLSLLAQGLHDNGREDVVVAGMSLGGFEVNDESTRKKSDGNGSAYGGIATQEGDEEDAVDCGFGEEDLLYPPTFHYGGASEQVGGTGNRTMSGGYWRKEKLFTLREQIELSYARIENLIRKMRDEQGDLLEQQEQEPVEVILMGHSVGAYICLELVRLWHERHHSENDPSRHTSSNTKISTTTSSSRQETLGSSPSLTPSTCILLTPTIQDIHLSPSGLIATPLLTHLPFLPVLAHTLLNYVLLGILPVACFAWLVSWATGIEPGSHGLKATLAFLKNERGVKQALYMAGWEMKEIRKDRWGDEVWGASHREILSHSEVATRMSSPRLFFWFAKEDHWVAGATKEAVLNGRAPAAVLEREQIAKPEGRPRVEDTGEVRIEDRHQREDKMMKSSRIRILETEGLVHAWCLKQSGFVARRVSKWLEEVWDEDP